MLPVQWRIFSLAQHRYDTCQIVRIKTLCKGARARAQEGARLRARWLVIRILKSTLRCQDAAQLHAVQSKMVQKRGAPRGTTFRRGLCRA